MFAKITINLLISVAIILTIGSVYCNEVSPDVLESDLEEDLVVNISENGTQTVGFTVQPTQSGLDATITVTTQTSQPVNAIPYELKCKDNEIASNCTNYCEATCEQPDREPCRRRSVCWEGCECKPGYVVDQTNWTCILKEHCPKCGANEHYRNCGPDFETTCANYENVKPYQQNSRGCVRGCFCDYGFVRYKSMTDICIAVDKCPQNCGANEYYEEDGVPCVRTSENPRPKCLDTINEPTCVCNTGFVRNKLSGVCEPLSTYVEVCGGNQTFSYCGSDCAQKCYDDSFKRQSCQTMCMRGCFCNDGYRLDADSNKCVLESDCVGKFY